MTDKETMQTEVYDKVKDVKNRFYNAKTQEEWDAIKEDYKAVMAKAKELMTPEFFKQYQEGIVNSVAKIYSFKQKQFNKAKFTPQPKVSYIFQDNLADALAEYIKVRTKLLEERLQKMQ